MFVGVVATDSPSRTDDVGIIVVDTTAAMIASVEIAKSTETADIGTSAMLIKRMVNKMMIAFGEESRKNHFPCVILINQTRFKPGVLFGGVMNSDPEGLHGDTLVNFVNGRSIPIKTVVLEHVVGDVWSFDEASRTFVPAAITAHYYRGESKDGDLLTITSGALDTKNGFLSATLGVTHQVLTAKGWRQARELEVGDRLITKYASRMNGTLKQFLLGTGCGDLTLQVTNPTLNGTKALFKVEDSKNPAYALWKVSLLSPFFTIRTYSNDSHSSVFISEPRTDLYFLNQEFLGVRHPKALLQNFHWLSFAVWLMDDGHYSRHR